MPQFGDAQRIDSAFSPSEILNVKYWRQQSLQYSCPQPRPTMFYSNSERVFIYGYLFMNWDLFIYCFIEKLETVKTVFFESINWNWFFSTFLLSNNYLIVAKTLTSCAKSVKQMEHVIFRRVRRFGGDLLLNGFRTCASSKNLLRFFSSVSRSNSSCLSHFVWLSRMRIVVFGIWLV